MTYGASRAGRTYPTLALIVMCLPLLAPATSAQSVGGDWDLRFRLPGWETFGQFGESIASIGDVSGDGVCDFIVGTSTAQLNGVQHGAVFVHSGADSSLLMRVDAPVADTWFAYNVDGTGDVNGDGVGDFIAGAFAEGRGVAYVFSGADGSILHRIPNPDPVENQFARSVAGAGDVDADGFADLLVGFSNARAGGDRRGSAFVYSGRDGSLIWRFNGPSDQDFLGGAVAGAGDVNGDGHADVLAGTYTPATRVYPSTVYLYSGADGSILHDWLEPSSGSEFGRVLAGAGDTNQDGVLDIIVGADNYHTTSGLRNAGSAFVFSGSDGALLHQFDGRQEFAYAGYSVDGAGDLNGDGFADLIVGEPYNRVVGRGEVGSARIYSGRDGSEMLSMHGRLPEASMGLDVVGAGDMDGDGLPEFIVSASTEVVGGFSDAGAVYVGTFKPLFTASVTSVSAGFGGSVQYLLDFKSTYSSAEFQLLGSASGIGPGGYLGLPVPLKTGDRLWTMMLTTPPPVFSQVSGSLDANGRAVIDLTIPAGWASASVGRRLFFAAVVVDTVAGVALKSSAAVPLTILP